MTKEYRIISIGKRTFRRFFTDTYRGYKEIDNDLNDEMNDLARQGFELIHVIAGSEGFLNSASAKLIFSRTVKK